MFNNNNNNNFGTNNKGEDTMNNNKGRVYNNMMARQEMDRRVSELLVDNSVDVVIEHMKEIEAFYQERSFKVEDYDEMEKAVVIYMHIRNVIVPKLQESISIEEIHEKEMKKEMFTNDIKNKFNKVKEDVMKPFEDESVASVTDKVLDKTDDVVGKAKVFGKKANERFGKWFVDSAKNKANR